jgi:phage terminase small subunit
MGKKVERYEDLGEKQKRFIDNYVRTGNAAKSAREAGYKGSRSTISSQANKLMNHPVISVEIARRVNPPLGEVKAAVRMVTTPDEVMGHMADIFYARVRQEVPTKDGVEYVPPSFREQVQAGRYLMQAMGMFDRKDKGREPRPACEQLDEQFHAAVKSLGFDGEEDDE